MRSRQMLIFSSTVKSLPTIIWNLRLPKSRTKTWWKSQSTVLPCQWSWWVLAHPKLAQPSIKLRKSCTNCRQNSGTKSLLKQRPRWDMAPTLTQGIFRILPTNQGLLPLKLQSLAKKWACWKPKGKTKSWQNLPSTWNRSLSHHLPD